MRSFTPVLLALALPYLEAKSGDDHPTLPTMWKALTDEPGAGKGVELYNFVSSPSDDDPSALWSDYPGCQRLIWIGTGVNAARYELGCEAVDCCKAEQQGQQVEFQIPNVRYTDPAKTVNITYSQENITTSFGETFEADAWSWCLVVSGSCKQSFTAYTRECDDCVNNVQLLRWSTEVTIDPTVYNIDFKDYVGVDADSPDAQAFKDKFDIPEVCQGNILPC